MLDALKSEAFSLGKLLNDTLSKQGISAQISHAKILDLLAKSKGFTGFQALSAKLKDCKYAQCPKCGAMGTLKSTSTVFIEAGHFDGKQYEFEGDAPMYQCERCCEGFTDYFVSDEALTAQDFELWAYETREDYEQKYAQFWVPVGSLQGAQDYMAKNKEALETIYCLVMRDARDARNTDIILLQK